MEKEQLQHSDINDNNKSNGEASKDPSVIEGEKAIETEKKIEGSSEEEARKDAAKWRSEG